MAAAQRLSLVHLTQPPRAPSSGPPPLLLLLHGVGSHEGDLIGLAPYLDGRFYIVSARAPIQLGPGMYGWYHVTLDPQVPVIDPAEAERGRITLLQFIDETIQAYSTDRHRVYLLGFSQGAIMSLSLALTRPEKLAGVAAMSGRMPPELPEKAGTPDARRRFVLLNLTRDPGEGGAAFARISGR